VIVLFLVGIVEVGAVLEDQATLGSTFGVSHSTLTYEERILPPPLPSVLSPSTIVVPPPDSPHTHSPTHNKRITLSPSPPHLQDNDATDAPAETPKKVHPCRHTLCQTGLYGDVRLRFTRTRGRNRHEKCHSVHPCLESGECTICADLNENDSWVAEPPPGAYNCSHTECRVKVASAQARSHHETAIKHNDVNLLRQTCHLNLRNALLSISINWPTRIYQQTDWCRMPILRRSKT